MAQSDSALDEVTVVVGAAVGDGVGHRAQPLFVGDLIAVIQDAAEAADGWISV